MPTCSAINVHISTGTCGILFTPVGLLAMSFMAMSSMAMSSMTMSSMVAESPVECGGEHPAAGMVVRVSNWCLCFRDDVDLQCSTLFKF